MEQLLFPTNYGAAFSECRKYRYALWRIWDESKPLVMFIGLNPSTANETETDATINKVKKISIHNGYGGFYMMNCFPFVSKDPKKLANGSIEAQNKNWDILKEIGQKCKDVVFAWGNFKQVDFETAHIISYLFPNAKALFINKNGSPKHPLYCKDETSLINYNTG